MKLCGSGDRKNRNHRNLPKSPPKSPKSPLKSGVGGDIGLGGAGRGKVGYACVKVLITEGEYGYPRGEYSTEIPMEITEIT